MKYSISFLSQQILLKDIDKIEARGIANYKEAFKFSFDKIKAVCTLNYLQNRQFLTAMFLKFNQSIEYGSKCNTVIMFLTDGGTDTAEDIFEMYNRPEKKVSAPICKITMQTNSTT